MLACFLEFIAADALCADCSEAVWRRFSSQARGEIKAVLFSETDSRKDRMGDTPDDLPYRAEYVMDLADGLNMHCSCMDRYKQIFPFCGQSDNFSPGFPKKKYL